MSMDVAFVGLGNMGRPMAANLAVNGHTVYLWNRTRSRCEQLASDLPPSAKVVVCDSPAEAAERADVIVSMLADEQAVFDVYENENGLISGMRRGAVAVEMSTIGPDVVARLSDLLDKVEAQVVDAPVSGSIALAEAGELTIMAGGDADAVRRVGPVLHCLGGRVLHMGPAGTGAAMKLAVNTVILGLNEAVSEGLVLAEAAGIDRLAAYHVFTASAVAAPFVHYRRKAFEEPDAVPTAFAVTLGEKDLALILDLAEQVGVRLPQAEANRKVLQDAAEAGWADHDVSAAARYLRDLREREPLTASEERTNTKTEGETNGSTR